MDYEIFCDLDGVLVNMIGGFETLFKKKWDSNNDKKMWQLIESYGKAKFFEELPWMPGGKELWSFITDNFMNVKILSSTGKNDEEIARGKMAWLRHHISSLQQNDIILVPNKVYKSLYSKPKSILIDDVSETIDAWNKKGGIGILFMDTVNVIEQLKEYIYG